MSPTTDLTPLTAAQERRAVVLCLVHELFPTQSPVGIAWLVHYVMTGTWAER